MLKYFCLLFVLSVGLYAQKYPITYQQLSHPLFESSQAISKLSELQEFKMTSDMYTKNVNEAIKLGFEVDTIKDSTSTKHYLTILRKLQKQHDSILRTIHKKIILAIKQEDKKLFTKLTSYSFDGLLQNSVQYKKALAFYKKQNYKVKNSFFEKRMKYSKLQRITEQEFHEEVTTSIYNPKSTSTKKKKVNLEVIDSGEYYDVYIENFNPYTVSVKVKGKYKSLEPSLITKEVISIKSGNKEHYLRLKKIIGSVSHSYNMSYTWILGDINAVHNDDFIYRFPYEKDSRVRVSQGFNGTTTHNGRSKYAVDFAMNVGTKIYAARAGTVVKVKQDSKKGGFDRKFSAHGNYVTIEHDDSTFATYYHLKHNGAAVRVGNDVRKGSLIAYSGNTGYSSGPHLHFAVFKANSESSTQTIKIKFLSENGVEHYIEKNTFYIAK